MENGKEKEEQGDGLERRRKKSKRRKIEGVTSVLRIAGNDGRRLAGRLRTVEMLAGPKKEIK